MAADLGDYQGDYRFDGRRLAVYDLAEKRLARVIDPGEYVQVIDVRTRRVLGPVAGLEGAGVARVLPDNRVALVLMLDERVLAMVDLHTRRVIAQHALDRRPDARRPRTAAWRFHRE